MSMAMESRETAAYESTRVHAYARPGAYTAGASIIFVVADGATSHKLVHRRSEIGCQPVTVEIP